MEMLINLVIQLISGVVGGNAVGAALKDYNLGSLGNTIAGALGGVGGGQLLLAAMPAIAGAAGGSLDVGAIISQIVGGGAGGAILTGIAGLVKNMGTSEQTHGGMARCGSLLLLFIWNRLVVHHVVSDPGEPGPTPVPPGRP